MSPSSKMSPFFDCSWLYLKWIKIALLRWHWTLTEKSVGNNNIVNIYIRLTPWCRKRHQYLSVRSKMLNAANIKEFFICQRRLILQKDKLATIWAKVFECVMQIGQLFRMFSYDSLWFRHPDISWHFKRKIIPFIN